jgi:hypothetical protein
MVPPRQSLRPKAPPSASELIKRAVVGHINKNIYKKQGHRYMTNINREKVGAPLPFSDVSEEEKIVILQLFQGGHIRDLVRFLKDRKLDAGK